VQQSEVAHGPAGYLDVGHLEGHAEHEREIHKVPVIRLLGARKLQAGRGQAPLVVEVMGIVQREHHVHEHPHQHDGADRQQHL